MTKDQCIALVKTIQSAFVFLGKAIQETKVPTGSISDDIEVLNGEIEEIIADIPDDSAPASAPAPADDI